MKAVSIFLTVALLAAAGCSSRPSSPPPPHGTPVAVDSVTLTYLGVAGWQLSAGPRTLLVDPYFTRLDVDALGGDGGEVPLVPDRAAIESHAPRHADVILVTHSHYDHLLDVPTIALATGAAVVGTESTLRVARAASVPAQQLVLARGGETFDWSLFHVRVIPALHSLIGMPTTPIADGVKLPMPASAYAEGGTLQYLVKSAGRSVLFVGTANFIEHELEGVRPDVAVVAVGAREEVPDYTCRLMRVLGGPKLVLTNHFDAFLNRLGDKQMDLSKESRDSLDHFADEVHACFPATRVVIPTHFQPIAI